MKLQSNGLEMRAAGAVPASDTCLAPMLGPTPFDRCGTSLASTGSRRPDGRSKARIGATSG